MSDTVWSVRTVPVIAVLVAASAVTAWLALRPSATVVPNAGTPTVARAADPAQPEARERVAPEPDAPAAGGPAAPLPEGAIRVLAADGTPAEADVYATCDRAWSEGAAASIGRAGRDGLLVPREPPSAPFAFLWAFGRDGAAGPEPLVAGGQTLTLGAGCTLELHVRHPDGTPLAGISCHVLPTWRTVATTDDDGIARMRGLPPACDVTAFTDPRCGEAAVARARTGSAGTTVSVDLDFAPGRGPFVLLRARADGPERDVRVRLGEDDEDDFIRPLGLRTRGAPVRLSLESFLGAPVTITARADGTRTAARRFEDLAPYSVTEWDVELSPGGVPARGRVVEADGSPAAGARVDLVFEALRGRGATTDLRGEFDVDPSWVGAAIRAVRPGASCSDALELTDEVTAVVLALHPGATVEGVVRDAASGRPIEGARVGLACEDGDPDAVETDAEGVYRFRGIPAGSVVSPYHVDSGRSVAAPQASPSDAEREAADLDERLRRGWAQRVAGTETIRIDLVASALSGAFARVRVVFPEGVTPPRRIDLAHEWQEADDRAPVADDTTLDDVTDVRRFLRRGVHRFRATAPGFAASSEPRLVVGGEDLADIVVTMRAVPRVRAHVVDGQGVPLRRKWVEVRVALRSGEHVRQLAVVRADASGIADLDEVAELARSTAAPGDEIVFTLDGAGFKAEPGDETVNLRVPAEQWLRHATAADDASWELEVPLLPPHFLDVRVQDTSGRPAPGVRVRWFGSRNGERDLEAVSDASGTLTLPIWAASDSLDLHADAPWIGRARILTWLEESEGGRTFTVDRRRSVRIRVVTADGTPIAHRRATWWGPSGMVRKLTDASGAFVADLPASDTTIEPDVGDVWIPSSVQVPAGVDAVEVVAMPLRLVRMRVEFPPGMERPNSVEVYIGTQRLGTLELPEDADTDARMLLPQQPLELRLKPRDPLYVARTNYDGESETVALRVERVPERSVTFRLLDESEHPLAARDVRIRDAGGRRIDAAGTTDADGCLTVSVPEIRLNADVEIDGFRSRSWSHDPEAPADGTVTLRLQARR